MFKKLKYFLPSYTQCWVVVFYLLIIGGVGLGLTMVIIGSLIGVDIINFNLVITYLLPMVPALCYFLFKGKEAIILKSNPPVPLNRPHFGKMNIVIFGLIAFVAIMSLGILIDPLSNIFPMPDALKRIYVQMSQRSVWSFLSIAVCAPIVEETYLRGMMERGMLYHKSPSFAILWSAFFFAFVHLNFSQAIPAFLLGVLFGWVYYRTHCLWATICMHSLNNASAFLIYAAYPNLKPDSSVKEMLGSIFHISGSSYIMILIASAVAIVLCVWLFNIYLPKHPDSFTPNKAAVQAASASNL